MLRDVFYYGQKPNVHPREKPAKNLEDARLQCTTEHFWIVNEFCDYTNFDWDFDFDFLPDDQVYAEEHINIWPSQHCKDSGTWLCNKKSSTIKIYREDVQFVKRKNIKTDNWVLLENVDESKFDFSWHPDPTDPPYIYRFGCRFYPATHKPVLEYVVPNATNYKYVETVVELLPNLENYKILHDIDQNSLDFNWRPDPTVPPYIYVWGNQHYPAEVMPTVEYHVPGATERKYIDRAWHAKLKSKPELFQTFEECTGLDYTWRPDPGSPPYVYAWGNQWNKPEDKISAQFVVEGATEYKYMSERVNRLADMTNWYVPSNIDTKDFDFSWEPNPNDPAYIYKFGTQWQKTGGPEYIVPGATEFKYVAEQKSNALPTNENWKIPEGINIKSFDFSWHPDDTEEPYIYVFGNQYYNAEIMATVEYHVPGATEIKYVHDIIATISNNRDRWVIPENIAVDDFDFDWIPNPHDPPFIYEFNTQWQKNGGIRYEVEGATEIKYMVSDKIKALPTSKNWHVVTNHKIKDFDYSWHPDNTEEPFIYVFGNQHHDARQMPTIQYKVEGAIKEKYVTGIIAELDQDKTNWTIPEYIDDSGFDYSWIPNPHDDPYIYEFNTQWQKNGGPKYVVAGATETKYMFSDKINAISNIKNYKFYDDVKIKDFDFSWHPDNTDPPYIYVFGNEQYSAEIMPSLRYEVQNATEIKYINDVKAVLAIDMRKWSVPKNIDVSDFDFSWRPDPNSPPYIYEFGTQWQSNGGPRYIVDNATEVKYVSDQRAKALPDFTNWIVPEKCDKETFDFSWHPDNTSPPYRYEFATQWQKNGGPVYVVAEATETKYVDVQRATMLADLSCWTTPANIDKDSFDYSWHPDNTEMPFIYEFGTVWNDRGGPIYTVTDAKEKKYLTEIKAKTLPVKDNWKVLIRLEPDSFDFSWVPHPDAPPYIYVFGNQWNRAEKESTVEYHVPGATDKKYVHDIIANVASDKNKFEILVPVEDFDFTWRPDPYDDPYIYVFGNTLYPAETMPTVQYVVDGATEIKYVGNVLAKLAQNKENWHELIPIDKEKFDFSWVPDPGAPPYIYVFGNQWNKGNVEHTIEYRVPGAAEYKYVDDIIAHVLPDKSKFQIIHPIAEESFDFSWRPNPKEDPYIYVFGNTQYSAEKMPTILYKVSGSTEKKYNNEYKAILAQNFERFVELIPVDRTSFDFSWVPDPHDEPYIYTFGNQWNSAEIEPTLEYHVKGATQRKYMPQVAKVLPDYTKWKTNIKIRNTFDYSWRPDPTSPPYIYVFGNQWNRAEIEPTVEYHVSEATDIKYVHDIVADVAPDMTDYVIPEGINVDDFDFSFRPDPNSPRYIIQFGTLADDSDGPIYRPKDHNGETIKMLRLYKTYTEESIEVPKYYITTTLEDLIDAHPDEFFWALNKNINYSNFDFNWRPSIEQARYVQVFGSPDAKETHTYLVSSKMYKQGFTRLNFITEEIKAESEYLADLFVMPDIFMIDRGNPESKQRFEVLKERFPNIQKARFLNSWVDTIQRCLNKSKTQLAWILNSELDYTDFDFKFYPNPWQMNMVHVFGTQYSHWGTTYVINKETFSEDTKWVKIVEHLQNLNFVKNKIAKATDCLYDIYLIDHGNKELETIKSQLEAKAKNKKVHVVKYNQSYLETLKMIVGQVEPMKENYIWVCNSVCDYESFDFSYICDPFAKENLHVFPTDRQKFGDTFLVDVNKFLSLLNDMNLLEDYDKINYNGFCRAKRLPAPMIKIEDDTFCNAANIEFDFPYAVLTTEHESKIHYDTPLCLWADNTKNIEILASGGTSIVFPQEAKKYIAYELYDYPYISKYKHVMSSKPLDIVFISNGEKNADENYNHLLGVIGDKPNRVIRIDGVNGRAQAYHAAAEASNSPWFFAVFAKLRVDNRFEWNWQPDRLQVPKHYIFNALNPVNGLVYGHQAMIAYNKKITLSNPGIGLDFTLDNEHEVVDTLSGVAVYNTDPYSTWRTAFREVIKLKSDYKDISFTRLNTWLTVAEGDFAEHSLQGARDGVEYYDNCSGDIEQLRQSYEWEWLRNYYNSKYK